MNQFKQISMCSIEGKHPRIPNLFTPVGKSPMSKSPVGSKSNLYPNGNDVPLEGKDLTITDSHTSHNNLNIGNINTDKLSRKKPIIVDMNKEPYYTPLMSREQQ